MRQIEILRNKKAVIFDLDGTLTDSMWVWSEIDRDFFRDRNMEFPDFLNHDIEGMSFSETAEYFVETFHLEESVEEIKETWNRMAIEKYRTKTMLKPGAMNMLQYLKTRDVKVGIATSNSQLLVDVFLDARQIRGYIDAVTTSCEVNRGKPAPDVYLLTAQKLGVSPGDCLVFEDIPMGILSGKNAGMTVCGIDDHYSADVRDQKIQLSDYFIKDFRELL